MLTKIAGVPHGNFNKGLVRFCYQIEAVNSFVLDNILSQVYKSSKMAENPQSMF